MHFTGRSSGDEHAIELARRANVPHAILVPLVLAEQLATNVALRLVEDASRAFQLVRALDLLHGDHRIALDLRRQLLLQGLVRRSAFGWRVACCTHNYFFECVDALLNCD